MSMLKKGVLIFLMCLMVGMAFAQSVPERELAQKLQQAATPQSARFNYLRFYLPSNTVPEKPGLWDKWFTSKIERQHQRALAFYLFNMYVTTNSYKQPVPLELTLNDIGVLDGFMRCAEPFDFKHASQFYAKNKTKVHAHLKQFFAGRSWPWPQPTGQDYERWAKLLETQPLRRGQAAYVWPEVNLLGGKFSQGVTARLKLVLENAHKEGQQKVVLYEEPAAMLEDFDSHIAPKKVRRKRTYRFVVDECNYMSYLIAKQLAADVIQKSNMWGFTRIYTLAATPAKGEFLIPAQGTRFKLANGQNGLKWRYHTAVLAVVPQNGSYVPVVLDTFLGGMRPLSVGEWLSHFSANTVFTATPFRPATEIENALRVPEKTVGNAVWVDGQKYTPAEVIK